MSGVERDGIRLSYEERGSGDPPLVFIHAWSAHRSTFVHQLSHFADRHRVLAVDLRGHGESDRPEQPYSMSGFADDVAWMCQELGVRRPVIVGHSMGGVVALALAADHPDIPRAVVALDSPIVPAPQLVEAVQPLLSAMRTPAFREGIRGFYGYYIGFEDRPEQREELLDRLAAGDQHVVAPALEDVFAFDSAAAAASCKVPVLYISAGPWHADIDRFRDLCPQLVTGQTVGSGHFHQLEVPDQINSMLERFIATLPSEDPAP